MALVWLVTQRYIYQTYHSVAAVIGFASIKATQLGDRLLAASFITSAAANLGVTLFIGGNYFSNNLSVCSLLWLLFSTSNVVVIAKSSITENGFVRLKQLCCIFDVCSLSVYDTPNVSWSHCYASLDTGAIYSLSIFLYLVLHTVSGQVFILVSLESLMVHFKLLLSTCLTQVAVSKNYRLPLLYLTISQPGHYNFRYHFKKLSQWSIW